METLAHLMDTEGSRFHVFLGRGGNSNRLRKDSLYRKLLKEHCKEYAKLDPKQKRKFAHDKVVSLIRERGGRFYKESFQRHPTSQEPLYVEVETHATLRVVMQALRDCLKEHINEQLPRQHSTTTTSTRRAGVEKQADSGEEDSACQLSQRQLKRRRQQSSSLQRVKQEVLPIPEGPSVLAHHSACQEDILRRVQRLEGLVCYLIRENEALKATTPRAAMVGNIPEGSDDEMGREVAVPQQTSV